MKVKVDVMSDGLVFFCADCDEQLEHQERHRLYHPGYSGAFIKTPIDCLHVYKTFAWPFVQELQSAPPV